jgi:hypothetical protein
VPQDRHRTAYALDSVGVELSFILGPAAGVLVATTVSTTSALLAVGGCMVVAGVALWVFDPPTRTVGAAPDGPTGDPATVRAATPPRRAWFRPALLAVLGAATGSTVVLATGGACP